MDWTTLGIFLTVYACMALGKLPGLALDRAGAALLGAIAVAAFGRMTSEEAWRAIDMPTICLLLGLMIVSAQFRLAGFYSLAASRVAEAKLSPPALLAALVIVSGGLSALLCNDIVCLAMTPPLLESCSRRGLNPMPFLLGLACASNVGSAATLVGNPQNMLLGQALGMPFGAYSAAAAVPVLAGLAICWGVAAWNYRGRWSAPARAAGEPLPVPAEPAPPFSPWKTAKGMAILAGLLGAFLLTDWPREVSAMAAGGLVLLSRSSRSRVILGLADWPLLVLFAGLFVVNAALAKTGLPAASLEWLRGAGVPLEEPRWLFACSVVLSNVVSNVPAAMLLLPAATHPMAGTILALATTFAGNLFIAGSVANLIVAECAREGGVEVGWREHFRTGFPVCAGSLAVAGGWLWILAR